MPLGALISGGLGLLGGVLGQKSAKSQQESNTAAQREFAQHGIRWKVEDAKKAGIHPLYAMGAQTHSYSPNPISQTDYGLGQAGQDIGRAIQAKQTAPERQLQQLQIKKAEAEIDFVQAQAALARSRTIDQNIHIPPMPYGNMSLTGQGPSYKPDALVTNQVVRPGIVKGPERTTHIDTAGGAYRFDPRQSDAEVLENRYGEGFLTNLAAWLGIGTTDLIHNLGFWLDDPDLKYGASGRPRRGRIPTFKVEGN